MDPQTAKRLAETMSGLQVRLGALSFELFHLGWYVSAHALAIAATLLSDVERRLRNGDDLKG